MEKFYDILRKQDDSFKSLWYNYSIIINKGEFESEIIQICKSFRN